MNAQNPASLVIAETISSIFFPLAGDADAPVSMPLFKFRQALRDAAEAGAIRQPPSATAFARLEDVRGQCTYIESALDLISVAPATERGGADYLIGPAEVVRSELQRLADQIGEIVKDPAAALAADNLNVARRELLEVRAVANCIVEVGLDLPVDRNMEGARGCARLLARQVESIYHRIDRALDLVDRSAVEPSATAEEQP